MQNRKLFAVTGNPAGCSYYPHFFKIFFNHDSLPYVYTRLAADTVEEAFVTAKLAGLSGINIASPFRMGALDFADIPDKDAQNIGAVNAILFNKEGKTGFNTEFMATDSFIQSRFGQRIGKVVILGTSADSMAISCGFATAGWNVIILNSTLSAAVECAVKCGGAAGEFDTLKKHVKDADLVVCAGLSGFQHFELFSCIGNIPVLIIGCDELFISGCLDMKFNIVSSTEFILRQAAAAYRIFTGKSPSATAMEEAKNITSVVPAKKNIISFTGFASTGKTTCGRLLADKLGIGFVDLDSEIEKQNGKSITKILDEDGFAAFNSSEERILTNICARNDRMVLACGCDTVFSSANRNMIKKSSYPVWLVSTSELIFKKRSFLAYNQQPGENVIESVGRLFEERKITYAETSEIVIRSDMRTPEQTVTKIDTELREKNFF